METTILAVSQLLSLAGILLFFFLREFKIRRDDNQNTKLLEKYFAEVTASKDEVLKLFVAGSRQLNSDYLKHIANIEKMIKPEAPQTRIDPEMVRQIMGQAAVDVNENQIESNEQDPFSFAEDSFRKVPITKDTRVVFEEDLPSDLIPTSIIENDIEEPA